ncbi:hypothetical protein NDU88_005527 [Pleurodeles waltl]|uniref:Uncharacterized protein n=1 Tax=Pleurodeles waltl TaxID=8319 RepID=A0AAV7TBA7_PLEWA|nr:hypothetical protein NDU88_005525 [Pleurodeles waltl]KAJ1173701.1 hypothetical protein NDU88_005527 [Pleurodeles waltl]
MLFWNQKVSVEAGKKVPLRKHCWGRGLAADEDGRLLRVLRAPEAWDGGGRASRAGERRPAHRCFPPEWGRRHRGPSSYLTLLPLPGADRTIVGQIPGLVPRVE